MQGDRTGPVAAVLEGLRAFAIVGAVGVGASVAVWLLADPAYGLDVAIRIGALYLGAFHHVPIRIEGEFDIGELTGGVLPGSNAPTEGTSFVEIGIALLAVTAFAAWLVFRAGRRLAGRAEEPWWRSVLRGAAVAPSYAAGILLVATLVTIDEAFGLGRLVEGRLQASLALVQAFVFPLVIAGVAGGAGGLWAWLAAHRERSGARRAAAALAGAWRMLWLGLALSFVGLFVVGVVQPDGGAALLTPSTARYFETVFARPALGTAIVGHHVAVVPNEAAWVLVPAMGACDVLRGSGEGDVLCYRSFPRGVSGEMRTAPSGYLLFLLVPAVATIVGGRAAAGRLGVAGRPGAGIGALAGVVFAAGLGVVALLSGVTLTYGATAGSGGGGGSLWVGPHVFAAVGVGLVWGVLGGALGGASASVRSAAARPAPRSVPR